MKPLAPQRHDLEGSSREHHQLPASPMEELSSGISYEDQHVHQVYERIAQHFSSTRYKPWPIVEQFLTALTPGSVGLDVGCGNGKYLRVNRDVFILASDRSAKLIAIAANDHHHSAFVADSLFLPHPSSRFDFALAIAVIHHLSTSERRVAAVRALLETLRPPLLASSSLPPSLSASKSTLTSTSKAEAPVIDAEHAGRALIVVWALEQKASRRGWDAGDEQDVLVPWVTRAEGGAEETALRYYHLYSQGELESDVEAAGGRVIERGYERDNWWVIAERRR